MSRKVLYIIWLFVVAETPAITQNNVSINNSGSLPDSSAILDLKSTTQGLLVPRMTTGQREAIASPATGLIVYDLDANSFWCYAGSSWIEVMAGFTSLLQDTDEDTKVQVEESPDDDIIRFDVEGAERWTMSASRLEPKNSGRSVFIGEGAGDSDDLNAHGNIAIGSAALQNNVDRSNLVAIGDSALYNNGTGATSPIHSIKNTAVGSNSLYANTTGYNNTATGYHALNSNISGGSNTAIGAETLRDNVNGNWNTALGNYALQENTSAWSNTAVGFNASTSNTLGGSNVAMGSWSLHSNVNGSYNVGIGQSANRFNVSGSRNTIIGHNAGYGVIVHNKSGNVYIGYQAGFNDTTDNKLYIENSNTSLPLIYGDFTNGSEVVGINGNLGVGTQAPEQRFHVKENGVDSVQTIVALLESSVSSRPLLLFSENPTNTLGSGMSIEYNGAAGFAGDNEMYINKVGGSSMVTFENNGKMGIATTAPTDYLHINAPADASALRVQVGGVTKLRIHQNGGVSVGYNPGLPGPSHALQLQNNSNVQIGSARAYSWVTYSDGRMKSQQEPLKYGMKEILQLQPKSYLHHSSHKGEDGQISPSTLAGKKDIGLIAQEVARIIPEIVFTPAAGSDDLWSVDYMRLVPVLISALQEQQEVIEKLEQRLGTIEQNLED